MANDRVLGSVRGRGRPTLRIRSDPESDLLADSAPDSNTRVGMAIAAILIGHAARCRDADCPIRRTKSGSGSRDPHPVRLSARTRKGHATNLLTDSDGHQRSRLTHGDPRD